MLQHMEAIQETKSSYEQLLCWLLSPLNFSIHAACNALEQAWAYFRVRPELPC